MTSFITDFVSKFWIWGAAVFLIGFLLTDLVGTLYHRWILHGVLVPGEKGGPNAFLYVIWAAAYEKHMWHHYLVYPDPHAPGTGPKPFRPRRDYYNGLEFATHKFGIVPSEHERFDKIEWYLSKLRIPFTLDWLIVSAIYALLAVAVIGWNVWFAWYFFGGLSAGWLSDAFHGSFHVEPYPRLRDVPWRGWLDAPVALANLGAHLPIFRRYYRYLHRLHVSHHFEVVKAADTNVTYRGVMPNVNVSNFTMFNPLTDLMLGSYRQGSDGDKSVSP